MTTLRWSTVKASSVNPKLRWAKVVAQGAAGSPSLLWSHVLVQGSAPVGLQPIGDRTVEPLSTVTLTAVPSGTTTPDGYQWRQISGPTATYQDNGNSITFTAPPSMTSTPAVFGVLAVKGGTTSAEVVATVNVYPHLNWSATSTGWVAQSRSFA